MNNILTEEIKEELIKYCNDNPVVIDYGRGEGLEKKQILKILGSGKGLIDFKNDLYEMNIDHIFDLIDYFIENLVENEFPDELKGVNLDVVREFFNDYIIIDTNFKQLLNNTGEIACLIPLYSNYDCCNSCDDPAERRSYLGDVYNRVQAGVTKSDFNFEFYNGAYGGSLFCFVFKTDIEELIDFKKQLKNGEYINIPAGAQFGFFSSFQGAGSVFEKTTFQDMNLRIKGDTKYDTVDIIADVEQNYSMADVYGGNGFINSQNISIK